VDLASGVVDVEIAKGVVIRVDKGYVFANVSASASAAGQTK